MSCRPLLVCTLSLRLPLAASAFWNAAWGLYGAWISQVWSASMAFSLVAICCGKSSAHHGLRTPDALQAACCLQLGQDGVMLSGDGYFERIAGLRLRLIR